MPDLSDLIETEAALPASSAADGQSATGRSIADLIAADQHLAAKTAGAKRRRGIAFTKLTVPGAISDGGATTGSSFNTNSIYGG